MSVVHACAEARAAIERARSLFGAAPESGSAAANSADALTAAARTTAAAGKSTRDLSGAFIDQHHRFVGQSVATLGGAARSDANLNTHLTTAAALTQTGAQRLDAIAAQTQTTSRAAATASTPAGQRAILAALRS